MTATEILKLRLANQQITGTEFTTIKSLTGYLGAIQSQDYLMAKWALGVRLCNTSDILVEQAMDRGEIVRTHVLRPTWHFVSIEDIRWILELTAPHIHSATSSTNKKLELDSVVFNKCNSIIEKTLEGKHLTREELMAELEKSGIATYDIRGAHIMMRAELDGIVCNGSRRGKQFTYALLEEKIPPSQKIERKEALAKLALRYFTSHGPATLQDFTWWSGLSVADAKAGLEAIKSSLIGEILDNHTYWFAETISRKDNPAEKVYFLPAFDEYLIGYADRTTSIAKELQSQIFTKNGIFKPIIVIDGKVAGTWKRTFKKDTFYLETQFLDPKNKLKNQTILSATEPFSTFLGMKMELVL